MLQVLHGSGERGSDNRSQLSQGLPPWLVRHGKDFPALVVIPQAPADREWSGGVVRYTEFPGVGHGSWEAAYATAKLWPWMFAHRLPATL